MICLRCKRDDEGIPHQDKGDCWEAAFEAYNDSLEWGSDSADPTADPTEVNKYAI